MINWDEYDTVERVDARTLRDENVRRMKRLMNAVYAAVRDNPFANTTCVRRATLAHLKRKGVILAGEEDYVSRAMHKLERAGGIESVVWGKSRIWTISAHNETRTWLRELENPDSLLNTEVWEYVDHV